MPTHLLDTSVYSQPLKPKPNAEVMRRWQLHTDAALATSIICQAEVLFGIKKKGSARLLGEYERLLKGRIPVLLIDIAVADAYAEIRTDCEKRSTPVADLDLLIAATAKAHNLIVATLNLRHFQVIQGITVEDWSKPDLLP